MADKATLRKGIEESFAKIAKDVGRTLPKGWDIEKVKAGLYNALRGDPKLLDMSVGSLVSGACQAGMFGLHLGGALGESYLSPEKKTGNARFMIGYKGLLNLARRSGEIRSIQAHVVRDGDAFEHQYGSDAYLKHEPKLGNTGEVIAAYAIARLCPLGGKPEHGLEVQFDVMSASEINRIRDRNGGKETGPWTTDYDAMAMKTVTRRLCKFLPTSRETQQAVAEEELAEALSPASEPEKPATAPTQPTTLASAAEAALATPTDPGAPEQHVDTAADPF